MMAHTCNPSIGEMEAGGCRVQSQPGLHSKTLFQKEKKKKEGDGKKEGEKYLSKHFKLTW
jgi:hypothetical protein